MRVEAPRFSGEITITTSDGRKLVIPADELNKRINEVISAVKQMYRDVALTILTKFPSLYLLIASAEIILSFTDETSWTDGERIVLSIRDAQTPASLLLALLHEAMHIVLEHPVRLRHFYSILSPVVRTPEDAERVRLTINVVADYKAETAVAEILSAVFDVHDYDVHLRIGAALSEATGIETHYLASASMEEILLRIKHSAGNLASVFNKLRRELKRNGLRLRTTDIEEPGSSRQCGGCVVIQSGSLTKEKRKMLRGRFIEELKTAGHGAGNVIRELMLVDKYNVPWTKYLRRRIRDLVYGGVWRRSWTRVNKRLPFVRPGIRRVSGVSRVYFLVDSSGSISDEKLGAFISEAAKLSGKRAKVRLVVWDYEVQSVVDIPPSMTRERVVELLRSRGSVVGGGGTRLHPALSLVLEELEGTRQAALVVIASDFFLTDEPETVKDAVTRLLDMGVDVVYLAPSSGAVERYRVPGVDVYHAL